MVTEPLVAPRGPGEAPPSPHRWAEFRGKAGTLRMVSVTWQDAGSMVTGPTDGPHLSGWLKTSGSLCYLPPKAGS